MFVVVVAVIAVCLVTTELLLANLFPLSCVATEVSALLAQWSGSD